VLHARELCDIDFGAS